MMNCLGRAHGADFCHPAHIVAAKIQQHQMFGQFLLVGQQVSLQRAVFFGRGAALAGAGDGADGDFAVAQADQNFGAGADHLKAAEVEEEHEGRGVGAAQSSGKARRAAGRKPCAQRCEGTT